LHDGTPNQPIARFILQLADGGRLPRAIITGAVYGRYQSYPPLMSTDRNRAARRRALRIAEKTRSPLNSGFT